MANKDSNNNGHPDPDVQATTQTLFEIDDNIISEKTINQNLKNNISDLQEELGQVAGTIGDIFDEFHSEMSGVMDSIQIN